MHPRSAKSAGGESGSLALLDLEAPFAAEMALPLPLTIEADLRLALELPEDPELTLETVDMVDTGLMVEVRPDKLLRPLSL